MTLDFKINWFANAIFAAMMWLQQWLLIVAAACGNHLRNVSYQEQSSRSTYHCADCYRDYSWSQPERSASKAYETLIRRRAGFLLLLMTSFCTDHSCLDTV